MRLGQIFTAAAKGENPDSGAPRFVEHASDPMAGTAAATPPPPPPSVEHDDRSFFASGWEAKGEEARPPTFEDDAAANYDAVRHDADASVCDPSSSNGSADFYRNLGGGWGGYDSSSNKSSVMAGERYEGEGRADCGDRWGGADADSSSSSGSAAGGLYGGSDSDCNDDCGDGDDKGSLRGGAREVGLEVGRTKTRVGSLPRTTSDRSDTACSFKKKMQVGTRREGVGDEAAVVGREGIETGGERGYLPADKGTAGVGERGAARRLLDKFKGRGGIGDCGCFPERSGSEGLGGVELGDRVESMGGEKRSWDQSYR